MVMTTTPNVEGRKIVRCLGIVTSETILGANIVRDLFAGIRDIVGGRAGAYEKILIDAKEIALNEMIERAKFMGANAIISIDLDYETIGPNGSMLMVSASGTAVFIE